jgi:succinoglycan biosynthesis protein ExoA
VSELSVSVVVPVRNEAKHIEACIQALLDQRELPSCYEVIVVDGQSDDGTKEILDRVATADSRIRVLDNPKRIVPTALNLGIRASTGDIVIRVDGHTIVAADFVRQNLQLLDEHPEAWSVGGPIAHRGSSDRGRGIAAAMSSPVGVGGASHRFEDYEGYAEGTAFPAFRRWVFDKIGLFDEDLVRNQDDELNFRITRSGGLVFISPRVKHTYYVRDSFTALFRQYLQYAYWKVVVMRKHRRVISPRHLIPGVFIVMMPVAVGAAVVLPPPLSWLAALPIMTYGGVLGYLGTRTAINASSSAVGIAAARAAATMHVAYGIGTVLGALRVSPTRGRLGTLLTQLTR